MPVGSIPLVWAYNPNIQTRILKMISPRGPTCCDGSAYEGKSKLAILMGDEFFTKIAGKVVIDFGCGEGAEAVEMASQGTQRVIGIDIREDVLQAAKQKALEVDTFEHFVDPAATLRIMNTLLQPAGEVLVSFGPIWYHPLGGHLFSVFPWAHLLFREKALISWRSTFKTDGATRFSEVAGGLNQMTIAKFEDSVAKLRNERLLR